MTVAVFPLLDKEPAIHLAYVFNVASRIIMTPIGSQLLRR